MLEIKIRDACRVSPGAIVRGPLGRMGVVKKTPVHPSSHCTVLTEAGEASVNILECSLPDPAVIPKAIWDLQSTIRPDLTAGKLVKEPEPAEEGSAFQTQVGGSHYKDMPEGYQPFQISRALGLCPVEHTVLKYLLRHKRKNGIEDLQKAKQTLDLLIELEYNNAK